MSDLVQIQTVPPWHQSTEFLTSCPTLYVESVIKGNPQPGGMDSARGLQVHHVGALYPAHCALKGVSSDLKAFDELAAGAGPVAARILSGMRDSFEVDHRHLVATELTMSLDANFEPTDIQQPIAGMGCDPSGKAAVVVGTLDALYSFSEVSTMRIDDLKTHPHPFDPSDKLQGKTYALLVFQHFPWVVKVVFRLIFVRWRNVIREVEFTREQVPDLISAITSARQRQKKIHADYEAGNPIEALAGNHCLYCPLLSSGACPIAKYNPQMQLTMEQRLNFNLYYSQFSRANNAALKAYVQEKGRPVVLRDYNGKAYVYGPEEKESEVYPVFKFADEGMEISPMLHQPVLPIIELLFDYYQDPENRDDCRWMSKVVISSTSLKRYLKTNRRAFLDQAIQDTCDKVTKVALRVSKPLDAVDVADDDEDEWEEDEL